MAPAQPPSPSDTDELQQLLSAVRDICYSLDKRLQAIEDHIGLRRSGSATTQYDQAFNEFEDLVDARAERLDSGTHPSPSHQF